MLFGFYVHYSRTGVTTTTKIMVLMKQFKEDNTVSRQKTSASKTAKAPAKCSQDSCNRPHGHTVDRVALWKKPPGSTSCAWLPPPRKANQGRVER